MGPIVRIGTYLPDTEGSSGAASNPMHVRILIVQDHPLLASSIARILDNEPDLFVCGVARSGREAATLAAREKPDVALLDFRLPDVSGPTAAGMILGAVSTTAIVFHSADESEEALLDAIDSGAIAYLTKAADGEQIVQAVRQAARGEVLLPVALFAKAIARQHRADVKAAEEKKLRAQFTPREIQILRLLADGLSTGAMADEVGIAPHTVEWHVRHVIEKLQVHSKLQAVIEASRKGLIDL
jgi:DNA-binding NarL/FixJ family response regulator